MESRKELKMKAAAVIHMFSFRNFKTGSYTRSLNVGGLVAISRHLGGRGVRMRIYIYMFICICKHDVYIYTYIHIRI